MADLTQQWLQNIGMTVEQERYDYTTWLSTAREGDFDIGFTGLTHTYDPNVQNQFGTGDWGAARTTVAYQTPYSMNISLKEIKAFHLRKENQFMMKCKNTLLKRSLLSHSTQKLNTLLKINH